MIFILIFLGLNFGQVPSSSAAPSTKEELSLDLIKSEKTDDLDASVQEQLKVLGNQTRALKKADGLSAAIQTTGSPSVAGSSTVESKTENKDTKSESEIPVLGAKKKNSETGVENLSNRLILSFIFVFGLLGGGLIFLRRYLQKNREKTT